MNWLEGLIVSGRAIDLVIAVIVIEAVALLIWKRRGVWPTLLGMLPGVCLLLALRSALTDDGWKAVALWVTASFPLHLADLRYRLRG